MTVKLLGKIPFTEFQKKELEQQPKHMVNLFNQLCSKIQTKGTWGKAEMITEINSMRDKFQLELAKEGKIELNTYQKYFEVDKLKRYDVVFMKTFGSEHYVLIYKVSKGRVYGFCLSTKENFSIDEIKNDRIFSAVNSYIAKGIVEYDHEEARKKFVRCYEDKKEADLIFSKLRKYHKELFSL